MAASSLQSFSLISSCPTLSNRPKLLPSFTSLYSPCSKRAALVAPCSVLHSFKAAQGVLISQKSNLFLKSVTSNSETALHAANAASGKSDESDRFNFDKVIEIIKAILDKLPEPVKSFPWKDAFYNYLDIIIQLFCVIIKYLCVPLLALTSLSELSYCAHERKMVLAPIPLLLGWFAAGSMNYTILEASTTAQKCEVPWHLLGIAVFFILLKLPGPYYPYWGRIFIPHFANGGLWRALWFFFRWAKSREQQKSGIETLDVKGET